MDGTIIDDSRRAATVSYDPDDFHEHAEQVRLLTADTGTGEDQLLTDGELATLLSLYDGNVRRAAAAALEAIAVSEVLVSKKIRTQDLSTDGPAVAAELRQLAKRLRDEADTAEAGADWFGFDVAYPGLGTRRPEHTDREVWGL